VLEDRWWGRQCARGGDREHGDLGGGGGGQAAEAARREVADRVDDAALGAVAGQAQQGERAWQAALEGPGAGARGLRGPVGERLADAPGVGAELEARTGGVGAEQADATARRQGLEDRGARVLAGDAQAVAVHLQAHAEGGVEQQHGVVRLAEHGHSRVADAHRAGQREHEQGEQAEPQRQQ
jgi:hypothetical protein